MIDIYIYILYICISVFITHIYLYTCNFSIISESKCLMLILSTKNWALFYLSEFCHSVVIDVNF